MIERYILQEDEKTKTRLELERDSVYASGSVIVTHFDINNLKDGGMYYNRGRWNFVRTKSKLHQLALRIGGVYTFEKALEKGTKYYEHLVEELKESKHFLDSTIEVHQIIP